MEAVLIFPHHLFRNHPGLKKDRLIILIEHPIFFSKLSFHKQKLVLHRASLKHYESFLKDKGYKTVYLEDNLEHAIKELQLSKIHIADLDDIHLENQIKSLVKQYKLQLETCPSPGFLTSVDEFQSLFKNKNQYRMDTFYIHQRKKLDILLDPKGKPLGGKWSMDQENRKRVPKSLEIPPPLKFKKTKYVQEAIEYVNMKYPKHPGCSETFNYPTSYREADSALKDFLEKRLHFFGDYEDAIVQKQLILFHSYLSPLLNIGLLTPDQVIKETLDFCENHHIPLNSLEGFIRQVIGWREFVRGIYHTIGEKQRKSNFFNHKRRLPASIYEGTTGILPIDATIKKLQSHAYLHHIERLMIVGNFFLLCEIDPNEVYKWFMELFIDSYDWVMVPNVYGMSQYADGGCITTKPYFSGSNYILKMSDFPKGEWCKIWDALFWRFMIKNEKALKSQPRLSFLFQIAQGKKKDNSLLKEADQFLKDLI